jgi:hypothetical protein
MEGEEMSFLTEVQVTHQGKQFFPPISSPGFHERAWVAQCTAADDGMAAEELQIRDAHTGDWIAYELLHRLEAAHLIKTMEDAVRRHDLPTVILTQGEAFSAPTFVDWAESNGILLEPNLGVIPCTLKNPDRGWLKGLADGFEPVSALIPDATGVLAGPALPDLGHKVAERRPANDFFMVNFKLQRIMIRDWEQCSAACVHPWDGRPHSVRLEFGKAILFRLLEAFPASARASLVRRLVRLSLPVQIELPSPVLVSVMQCMIREEDAARVGQIVPFQVLQVRVCPVGAKASTRKVH